LRAARLLVALLVTLSTVTACDNGDESFRSTGTAPSPVSPPPPTGQVSVRSIAPASGATLSLKDCTWEPETSFGNTQLCTAESRIALDLEFETEVTASVVAYFYRGAQICARSERLFHGRRGSVELNIVSLTSTFQPDEVLTTTANRCPLPVVTTRIVLKVLERSSFTRPLQISQEFAHAYTFNAP
jgi:hypothetical protein